MFLKLMIDPKKPNFRSEKKHITEPAWTNDPLPIRLMISATSTSLTRSKQTISPPWIQRGPCVPSRTPRVKAVLNLKPREVYLSNLHQQITSKINAYLMCINIDISPKKPGVSWHQSSYSQMMWLGCLITETKTIVFRFQFQHHSQKGIGSL